MTHEKPQSPAKVRRRTVTRGAAWTIPVVTAATSAPAFAAVSGGGGACTYTPTLTSLSCLDATQQVLELVVCFTSNCDGVTYVDLLSITGPDGGDIVGGGRTSYVLTKGSSQCQQVTFRYPNAGYPPSTLNLNTVYSFANGENGSRVLTIAAPTKPCC